METDTVRLPENIVDSHCHGRDLNQKYKTTIRQVLLEAQRSNIATTVFMPNTDEPLINISALNKYLVLISKACMEFGVKNQQYVYFGLTDDNIEECAKAVKDPLVIGIKVYPSGSVTTGSIGTSKISTLMQAMTLARNADKVIAFHCDDPAVIAREGNTINAEVSYIDSVIKLARMVPGVKVVICHVSCQKSAELIINAQKEGLQIAMELVAHYLWFDASGTHWNPALNPVLYHCYNNLRSYDDRLFLIKQLATDNPLILIGSDSACHTEKEKLEKKLGGIPSNQEMVPVMITLARDKHNNISESRMADLISFNAARFLNIPVSSKMISYEIEERTDNLQYNNGIVLNPWNGSKLWFPVLKK